MMSETVEIGWWIAFPLISLLLSGMEVAFVTSDKLRYAVTKKDKGPFNFVLNTFYKHPYQFLSTLAVGKIIILIFFVYFTMLVVEHQMPVTLYPQWLVLLLVILSVTFVLLLVDELIPRAIFNKNSSLWVRVFALPVFIFYVLFYPVVKLFAGLSKGVLRLFGVRYDNKGERAYGLVDLDAFVKKSIDDMAKEGDVESEVKIFRNALDFTSTKLRDCMVPRPEIVAVSIDTDLETLKEKFIETGISRILVYKGDIDDIVGYIHMWEIFNSPDDWTNNVAAISFVPESMQANQLMSDLMQQRKSIAVVVDEFGGTSGIVTMEDLVEEIFGEIEDEYDVTSNFIKQEETNEYVMSGRVEIDYLNEHYDLDIPESDDYSTVAGYLLYHTRRFPTTYETIIIENFTFKILKVTARKIEVVRLVVNEQNETR